VEQGSVNEIIFAVNATIKGQTTVHYVTDLLRPFNVNITRLAHGVSVGGELDYLDGGTLAAAIQECSFKKNNLRVEFKVIVCSIHI
jgi:recombination protein RecR